MGLLRTGIYIVLGAVAWDMLKSKEIHKKAFEKLDGIKEINEKKKTDAPAEYDKRS